jgi:hypothetical protein
LPYCPKLLFLLETVDPLKILFLTHRVPFPQNSGYPIVVCNTIRGLVNLGYDVSLVALNAKNKHHELNDDDRDLISKINYRAFDIDTGVSVFDVAINLLSKTSFNIDRYYDAGLERLLIQTLKNTSYDIIQFDGLLVSLYLAAVRKNSKAKLIYRLHNIENQIWLRLAQQKNDPFKKSYLRMHAKRIKNYELKQLNNFDGIAVFTSQDKSTLLEYGTKIPIEILPMGINLDNYKPDLDKTEFPTLFFLGSLDWLPNREGIEWFLENFRHDLTEGELRVRFYVAGNDIPERFDDYEVMGKIFIQGEVDDALEFINSKAIMIVPLLSGGGMRVKIVEGMDYLCTHLTPFAAVSMILWRQKYNTLLYYCYSTIADAEQFAADHLKFCKSWI